MITQVVPTYLLPILIFGNVPKQWQQPIAITFVGFCALFIFCSGKLFLEVFFKYPLKIWIFLGRLEITRIGDLLIGTEYYYTRNGIGIKINGKLQDVPSNLYWLWRIIIFKCNTFLVHCMVSKHNFGRNRTILFFLLTSVEHFCHILYIICYEFLRRTVDMYTVGIEFGASARLTRNNNSRLLLPRV